MARATHNLSSKIYSYGCRVYPQCRALLIENLRRAAAYKNRLVEIERAKQSAVDALRSELFPDYRSAVDSVAKAEERVELAYLKRNQERQRTRKRSTPEKFEQQIAEAKAALKPAYAALRAEREKIVKLHQPANAERKRRADARRTTNVHAMADVNAEILEQMLAEDWPETWKQEMRIYERESMDAKGARRDCHLGAANQRNVEGALAAAKVKTAKEGGSMRFQRGIGGRVAVDLGSGIEVKHGGYGCSSPNLKMLPMEPESESRRSRERRKTWVGMRVARGMVTGDDGSRRQDGVDQLEFWALLHRPLPDGALIKQAWVLAQRTGMRWKFSLQLVVQGEGLGKRAPATRRSKVEVELCSEGRDDGSILAARWSGSDGDTGEIVVDARTVEALWELDDNLKSAIDTYHNEARDVLARWATEDLGKIPVTVRVAGEEKGVILRKAMAGAKLWRTPGRMCAIVRSLVATQLDHEMVERLWKDWKKARLPRGLDLHAGLELGSTAIRDCAKTSRIRLTDEQTRIVWLEWWRRKNEHLRKLRENQRETAQRRRLTAGGDDYRGEPGFRIVASKLSGVYQKCEVIETSGTLKNKSRKLAGRGVLDKVLTRRRKIAGGSLLKGALKNAFGKADYLEIERVEEAEAAE